MPNIKNPEVAEVFNRYPQHMRIKLMFLRQLVFDTAAQTTGVDKVEEALKWGEPSYLTKGGSTIRIGWNDSSPQHYAMYFHCKTRLIDTFKELYGDKFKLERNRAIIFNDNDEVPVEAIKHCISLSLTYHSCKNLPLLGA